MPNKKPTPKQTHKKNDISDIVQTPVWALEPLLPFLPKDRTIWEPAMGKGNLVNGLKDLGYDVIGSDIITGFDFFKTPPFPAFDIIVTNPPYSNKDHWIGHCYTISSPFALLLPITALEGKFRQALYRENGLQVIFFDKRVNFEVPSGKNAPWFPVAWFTWGLNLPSSMVFYSMEEKKHYHMNWRIAA